MADEDGGEDDDEKCIVTIDHEECVVCHKRNPIIPTAYKTFLFAGSACIRCMGGTHKHPRPPDATGIGPDGYVHLPAPYVTTFERIHQCAPFYGLDWTKCTIRDVRDSFAAVARSTRPRDDRIEAALAARDDELGAAIGIHVRATDKLDPPANPVEAFYKMTRDEWLSIREKCVDWVRAECGNRNIFFICSDDPKEKKEFQDLVRLHGGRALDIDDGGKAVHGEDRRALLDFFALARCRCILQCTKFSTFSMAASMVGQARLVNFYGWTDNPMQMWRGLLNVQMAR